LNRPNAKLVRLTNGCPLTLSLSLNLLRQGQGLATIFYKSHVESPVRVWQSQLLPHYHAIEPENYFKKIQAILLRINNK